MNAKQRKLKKLAIILLAVIAILAISIPVFAATKRRCRNHHGNSRNRSRSCSHHRRQRNWP